jgi:cobalt-precorrin 5A hydrolase
VVALTPRGAALARRLAGALPGAACWLPEHLAAGEPGCHRFTRFAEVAQEAFARRENLVCIMAAGIVVRTLAPLLQDKAADPAVVVVDEGGRFAVSLLSGHLGGANDLARQVAAVLGGTPVITTATDVAGLPALDALAPRLGLRLENLAAVRAVSMALLAGDPVTLVDPEARLATLTAAHPECFLPEADPSQALTRPGPGVYVGCREHRWPPDWLRLRPRILTVGVGCHRGIAAEAVEGLIREIFSREKLSLACLRALATVAARKDEPGLREAARRLGVEFLWFTAAELAEVRAPNPSAVAARHLGTPSVAEAAALRAAGGRLLVPKVKGPHLTLAVAREP